MTDKDNRYFRSPVLDRSINKQPIKQQSNESTALQENSDCWTAPLYKYQQPSVDAGIYVPLGDQSDSGLQGEP